MVYYKYRNENYGIKVEKTVLDSGLVILSRVLDHNGNVIIDQPFRKIDYLNENIFCMTNYDTWKCYDTDGVKKIEHQYLINYGRYYSTNSSYHYFEDDDGHYVYDNQGHLVYQVGKEITNLLISKSNKSIVTTKENKVISYNIETKEENVIYKTDYTITN